MQAHQAWNPREMSSLKQKNPHESLGFLVSAVMVLVHVGAWMQVAAKSAGKALHDSPEAVSAPDQGYW